MIVKSEGVNPSIEESDWSAKRIRAFFEQCPSAIQIFNSQGECVEVNAAWGKLWGTSYHNLAGYNALKDPEIAKRGILPLFEKAFSGETVELPPFYYNTHEAAQEGRPRWIKSLVFPLKNSNGVVLEVALIMEDITAEKMEEAQLEADNEELSSVNSELTGDFKIEQLKKATESSGQNHH